MQDNKPVRAAWLDVIESEEREFAVEHGLLNQQYTGTEIADIIAATEKVLDKYPAK